MQRQGVTYSNRLSSSGACSANGMPIPTIQEFSLRARSILSAIEVMHMIRKGQMEVMDGTDPSGAEPLYSLAIYGILTKLYPFTGSSVSRKSPLFFLPGGPKPAVKDLSRKP